MKMTATEHCPHVEELGSDLVLFLNPLPRNHLGTVQPPPGQPMRELLCNTLKYEFNLRSRVVIRNAVLSFWAQTKKQIGNLGNKVSLHFLV